MNTMNAYWQSEYKTNAEALYYLLRREQHTDCTFIVGEENEKKVFKAHKLILSLQSPVMDTMCYGAVPQDMNEIRVTDIHPSVFDLFLSAIYTEKVHLATFSDACGLFYAGSKYMVQRITDQCLAYIKSNITPSNAAEAYEFFLLYGHTELAKSCFENIIKIETSDILNSEGFTKMEKATLIAILKQDTLGVKSEVELYDACSRWVDAELERQGTTEESDRKALMREFVPYLRFKCMSQAEFLKCTGHSSIFNSDELLSILWNLIDPKEAPDLPPNISKEFRLIRPNGKASQPHSRIRMLRNAAKNGNMRELRRLKKAGADLSMKDDEGWSLHHFAAKEGEARAIRWLLDQGLSVHDTDNEGWTPLHFAASEGRLEVVQLLLERGADPRVKSTNNETALDLALTTEDLAIAVADILRQLT